MNGYDRGLLMDNFEEILLNGSEGDMQELKAWLFRENIRLMTASKEFERRQEQFLKEKIQFQEEMKMTNHKISVERQRLKEENRLFDEKVEILKKGFSQLDIDRRRLDKEWARFAAEKDLMSKRADYESRADVSVFFQGVKNPLALKKRYKDLIKIFHPDNMAGDKEIIQRINREYENLKGKMENYKQA